MSPSLLRALHRVMPFLAVLLLAACATLPDATDKTPLSRQSLDEFALEGRFSLRQGEKNHSGRLSWRHTAAHDELLLSSPFGQGIAGISVNAQTATLTTSDGKTYSASDAQTLTEQVLGYRLPLEQLTDWVRGRSAETDVVERDGHGRPLRLQHLDWHIEFAYDGDASDALPGRLFAERTGAFELRLRIDEWSRIPAQERNRE